MRVLIGTLMVSLALMAGLAVGEPSVTPPPAFMTADPLVTAKLEQILATQADIIRRLDTMAEELKIIKVRASRSH